MSNTRLPDGQQILLTDTVGFIRKLPHHLIEAFKSTLEEVRYCDIILHVTDSSSPQMERQMYVVYETLKELRAADKTVVAVFNKMDAAGGDLVLKDPSADRQVKISARTGQNVDRLLEILSELLRDRKVYFERIYPYAEAGRIQEVRRNGEILEEEYTEQGIRVRAYVPKEVYGKLV